MAVSTFPALKARPKSVHQMRPARHAVPGIDTSLIGRDQFTEERRRRLKTQQHRVSAPVR
jgi:hypothetical protein